MCPYWHVPRATLVEAHTDGTFAVVCETCGKTIKQFKTSPTTNQIDKAAKGHKH